ncbi:MAG: D-alanyl-D-alanine dipeptidase [Candidatus Riflebacteria bacterium]|nr:D-alanyl-D-alanine dipeptidase [Candidatus Riflebacteria bacterium]
MLHKAIALLLLLASLTVRVDAGHGDDLVDVASLDPTIRIDMRYASDRNFLKQVLYDDSLCLLRRTVAQRLVRVQKALSARGLGLKVWDAYRPQSVQVKLWKILPDDRFVANPAKGSRHSRGAAVDLTLVDAAGNELPMGTDHDEFTTRAYPGSTDVPVQAQRNRRLLRNAMAAHGFSQMSTEWWHFEAPGATAYSLLDQPLSRFRGKR